MPCYRVDPFDTRFAVLQADTLIYLTADPKHLRKELNVPVRRSKSSGPKKPLLALADADGPTHQFLSRWAAARPVPSNFDLVGRGPAPPVKFSEDGPHPGPAHQFFKTHGPARPDPSFFLKPRAGPAHHMAAWPMRYGLYMGRPDSKRAGPWI